MTTIPMPDWRSRWLTLGRGRMLHRVSSIKWGEDFPEQMISGEGTTVCGRSGYMHMAGIFSRMGLKRCPVCCEAMGIANGNGCPENQDIYEPGDAPLRNTVAGEESEP